MNMILKGVVFILLFLLLSCAVKSDQDFLVVINVFETEDRYDDTKYTTLSLPDGSRIATKGCYGSPGDTLRHMTILRRGDVFQIRPQRLKRFYKEKK